MYGPREKVFWFSVLSRATVILLQFAFNVATPDHAADAFRSPRDPSEGVSTVEFFLSGLTRWDGQYFLHVARYGYTHENTLAFFPGYPFCVHCIATILRKVLPSLDAQGATVLGAVLLSYFCFVKSALVLYDLSVRVLGSTSLAYKATILYCVNPASIFFSAAYSESMFAYLTFRAMLCSWEDLRFAWLPIGLSCLVRSNGLVNLGFPLFVCLRQWMITVAPKLFAERSVRRAFAVGTAHSLRCAANIFNTVFLSLVPFVFFQIYVYLAFCTEYYKEGNAPPAHVEIWALKEELTMPGDANLTWCRETPPVAYSTIQRKYWNVGFLRYYELKQVPNFILAAPIVFLMLSCARRYSVAYRGEFLRYLLGTRGRDGEKFTRGGQLPIGIFPFVVHGTFLTLFAVLFVHIQVSTRLLASASPLVYWHCADALSYRKKARGDAREEYEEPGNLLSRWRVFFVGQKSYTVTDGLILLYFLGYLVLGCFMFSNFLPWT